MIITPETASFVQAMKRHAASGSYFDGRNEFSPYFLKAKQFHAASGTLMIYTRDVGMHSSGWFKNPDYERCLHLSLSFWDAKSKTPTAFDDKLMRVWVNLFYGHWGRYVWEESQSRTDNPAEVRHYRVLCDPRWQPIIPRGEVYTRDFIEKGWKSFSDQRYDRQQVAKTLIERLDE